MGIAFSPGEKDFEGILRADAPLSSESSFSALHSLYLEPSFEFDFSQSEPYYSHFSDSLVWIKQKFYYKLDDIFTEFSPF